MKKVMVGILILIPIIILGIVITVSNFLKVVAWIGVDSIRLVDKTTGQETDNLTVVFTGDVTVRDFYDLIGIDVMPEYANRYTVEWRIAGDIECMDSVYEQSYQKYLEELEVYNAYLAKYNELTSGIHALEAEEAEAQRHLNIEINKINENDELIDSQKNLMIQELREEAAAATAQRDAQIAALRAERNALVEPEIVRVDAPATLVDDNGQAVSSNTSGKYVINACCRFTVVVQVESITKTLSVTAEGYDVESITIVNIGEGDNTMSVGEKKRVDARFNPMSSIVTDTIWISDRPEVATVDGNGVITAHSAGEAKITVKANRYDAPDVYVESEEYVLTVSEGVSRYGLEFSTSKTAFPLSDIGVNMDDVTDFSGCTVRMGVVEMTADTARIVTDKGVIVVNSCAQNAIAIENGNVYNATSGYVFAVSGLPLKLNAVWADAFETSAPEGVVWETSDSKVATVSGGVVKAINSGLVEITAKVGNARASVILNVQVKVVSMKLRTSDETLAVGLARETVFAAEKFADDTLSARVPNSVFVEIIGAPQRTEDDTDATFDAKLRVFYNSYTFEIIEGGEYARFEDVEENPANYPNKLVFDPAALEGKGKQKIVVKVSAKYPKYESATQFTTETVDINVIYGVEVSNIAQLRKAADIQYEYAHAEGNLMDREIVWEHFNRTNGRNDRYRVYNSAYSKQTYGITFTADIPYEINPDGSALIINDGNSVKAYGDIYGNGFRLSAERDQVDGVQAMLWIAWSNVTVSNLNIRANKLDKDGSLSASETQGLKGECFQVFSKESHEYNRIVNVKIEFGIMENARRAGQSYNADVAMDGLVIRNIDSTAFYIPARMHTRQEEDGVYTTVPDYSHTDFNNCVFSNCINTLGSFAYERFTVMPNRGHWTNPMDDYDTGQGRFVRDDPVANAEYFMEHFASAGINAQVRQTGFLDAYNWQDVRNASFIDVGDASTNQLIGQAAGYIIGSNSIFANYRFRDDEENTWYFHMGFITSGITFDMKIMDEPSYLDITFEDGRFAPPIETRKMQVEGDAAVSAFERILKGMEIKFYGYYKDANITPYSTYEINDNFITRLHTAKEEQ